MKARHEFESSEDYQDYLRVYFSGIAMQGFLVIDGNIATIEKKCEAAVRYADALIKELNDKP